MPMNNPLLQNLLPQMGLSLLGPLVQAMGERTGAAFLPSPFLSQPQTSETAVTENSLLRTPPFRQRVGAPLLPIALGTWLSLPAAWPSLSKNLTVCAPASERETTEILSPALLAMMRTWLEPVLSQLPNDFSPVDAAAFQNAIAHEAYRRFEAFLGGVRAYQNSSAVRETDPSVQVVWEAGTTRLLDYAPNTPGPVLLVVPSLVNRFEILDIDPEHSFLRFLAARGFHPLVVDWQAPGEEEKGFSLSDYMTKRLLPLMDFASGQNGGCHVLGYCMGGMLALALSLFRPAQTKTLTLMATPWDFAAAGVGGVPPASTQIGSFFVQQAEAMEALLDQIGYLPADFLQAVFTSFQPIQVLQKYIHFTARANDKAAARRFVLTEDWLNNGVPLSLAVARECLRDWYKTNLPARLKWSLAGKVINPREIETPTFLLVAGKDRIVPPEAALPLSGLIRGATLHKPEIGHIGLMTGDAAPQEAWAPFVKWLRGHE